MNRISILTLLLAGYVGAPPVARAQLAPKIGYVFPPGGTAGATVEVRIGGYDWTPDMELFVHDSPLRIEIVGPSSEVLMPEPPYWFGAKGRGPADPLPREFPARIVIPPDARPGPIRWQAANANGASPSGVIWVGSGAREVLESASHKTPQPLGDLPVAVAGQIKKIEEIDRYTFVAPRSGPVTCELFVNRIGSPLSAILQVRDSAGRLIADAADTEGEDACVTFAAQALESYTVSVHDLDYHGDRSCVYRLEIQPGSRVIAAIPSAGQRGTSSDIEFIGWGVASGAVKLESIVERVDFPADPKSASVEYRLKSAGGSANAAMLLLSDLPEPVEPASNAVEARTLSLPAAVTGVLEQRYGQDRYACAGKKADRWLIRAEARRVAARLDLALAVFDSTGKQVAQNDDAAGTTDAVLDFVLPADGEYHIAVSDSSGKSGDRSSVYRLTVEPSAPDFALTAPEMCDALIGGKATLAIKATRSGGFIDPIHISFAGLPAGVTAPADLVIPANKLDLKIELASDAEQAAAATLATVSGTGGPAEKPITHAARPTLVARTIKPPFTLTPEGKDDVRTWPRGSTFPSPVLIARDAGFTGDIRLEMTSKQERHRQGVAGPEMVVTAGIERFEYPIFMPEWLETTKTSRLVINGVVQIPDPKGKIRHVVGKMNLRMGMLPKGALLKIAHAPGERDVRAGATFEVPITITRAVELLEPLMFELRVPEELSGLVSCQSFPVDSAKRQTEANIRTVDDARLVGEQELTIRATALQKGRLAVVAETTFVVNFLPADGKPGATAAK